MRVLITAGTVKAHYKEDLYITKYGFYEYLGELANALLLNGFDVTLFEAIDASIKSVVSGRKNFFTYEEYRTYLLYHAKEYDAIILGAEVIEPICQQSKVLNSDLHKDIKTLSPNTKIFGTYIANQTDSLEMIRDSAHKQALATKASAVIIVYPCSSRGYEIVLKEKSVLHPHDKRKEFIDSMSELIRDEFYTTEIELSSIPTKEYLKLKELIKKYSYLFKKDSSGYMFGTVALRSKEYGGFLTTGRGKQELNNIVWVTKVDDAERKVYSTPEKATLNAPLLNYLFNRWPDVEYIVHTHEVNKELTKYVYAPPGSIRDSIRNYLIKTSFVIDEHGTYYLYIKDGNTI